MKKVLVALLTLIVSLAIAQAAQGWVQAGACRLHVYTPGVSPNGQRFGRELVDTCRDSVWGSRRLDMTVCLQANGNARWFNIYCWRRGPFNASVVCTWAWCPYYWDTTPGIWLHGWLRDFGRAYVDNNYGQMWSTAVWVP